jgi:hypothetical protein
MTIQYLAVGCVALMSLQGCCKKSDASSSGGASSLMNAAVQTLVPVVEASKPPAQQRTYVLDWPGDGTLTYVRIKQVVVGSDNTTVTVLLENTTRKPMSVSTAPPGDREAFYLQRADKKKRFKLLRVDGLPLSPQRTDVAAGESLQFTLTFEPIEPTMTVFDLHEGDEQRAGTTYWNFSHVRLQ